MKATGGILEGLIINWLEATLIKEGRVRTNEAVEVFGIKRQNMAAYVKTWQGKSALPVYDRSLKYFVIDEGKESVIFTDEKQAATFLRALNKSLSFITRPSLGG